MPTSLPGRSFSPRSTSVSPQARVLGAVRGEAPSLTRSIRLGVNAIMRTTLLATAVLGFGLPLCSQTLGEISGRVSDPSGAGVPGANLTLTNTSTNAVRQAVSGEDGFYDFPAVPPGIYNLNTEHPGFKTAASANVEVQIQQTVRLDLT